MRLEDPTREDELIAYLREAVPAVREMAPELVTTILDGYPGALQRWVDERPEDEKSLRRLAREAQNYQHPDVARAFRKLHDEAPERFDLAVCLALLPEITTPQEWAPFTFVVGDDARGLGDLCSRRLLEGHHPPTFGHTTRYAVAARHVRDTYPADVERVARRLAISLGERVTALSIESAPMAMALLPLRDELSGSLEAGLVEAAASLFGIPSEKLSERVERLIAAVPLPTCGILVAMGLFNTLNAAKEEGNLERRDALLEELRGLQREEPAVAEQLAKGLGAALISACEEQCSPNRVTNLLDTFRTLSDTSELAAVRRMEAIMLLSLIQDLPHGIEEAELISRLMELFHTLPEESDVYQFLQQSMDTTEEDVSFDN
jgi:hypothetical protein